MQSAAIRNIFPLLSRIYYRLSRDEDEEMNSLQNQRQILVDYAEQNGYEIVGESFDDNVSGMTFNRKGLGELEIAVDEGKIDVVLVKDLSRLGRHRTQTELFIDHLRQNNVNEQVMLAHKCKQRCDNLKSSGNICQYLIIHVVQKDQRYSRTDRTYDHALYDERRPYKYICRTDQLHDPYLFLSHRDTYGDSVAYKEDRYQHQYHNYSYGCISDKG